MKMVPDEFEMENQGYEEEVTTIAEVPRGSSLDEDHRCPMRGDASSSLRNDPEAHVYEDMSPSPSFHRSIASRNSSSRLFARDEQRSISGSLRETNVDKAGANFHRNLTLASRARFDDHREITVDAAGFSARVNRERSRFSCDDTTSRVPEEGRDLREDFGGTIEGGCSLLDKPAAKRIRRKRADCKRCRSEALRAAASLLTDENGRRLSGVNGCVTSERLLPDDPEKKSIFLIGKNLDSPMILQPQALDRDKYAGTLILTPSENNRAAGMRVNSIYSQEHWRCSDKDLPKFFTDLREEKSQQQQQHQSNFQRAYSLPTRAYTPSSQNRVNLRRSARGEPPPAHPARLRKNRHGWTLDLVRPLDGATSARSIVLVLTTVLALLSIGGIALCVVFEPEKLEIIRQYLRSSVGDNATAEINETSTMIDSVDLSNSTSASEELLAATWRTIVETTTTTTTTIDPNATRYCDDCYENEVCVALVDEDVPICRTGPDPSDPTGCSGLCLVNKQKCHRLDRDAFRCLEIEHYCLEDEWTCANTLCIPLVKHCDGHMNCYDHSDEYDCACNPETHFRCGNETSCLPADKKCDGKIDCWDATDEINCTIACPSSGEFTCSNGECISRERFCDGLPDCSDGSDEPRGCQGRCNKHEFSCLNGRCITKGMRCNGIDDCGDNSEERHCRAGAIVKS